ncbi:MAG: hypothetical protein ACHREM_09945 [Polyangiales bacterium]
MFEDNGWTEAESEPQLLADGLIAAPHAAASLDANGDDFCKVDRKLPKTTPWSGEAHALRLEDLLARFKTGRLSDAVMRSPDHVPRMTTKPDFGRVVEEQENVVVEGWALAASKESDNDFHVILGSEKTLADDGSPDRWKLINIEVSGLSPVGTSGRQLLVDVRKTFKAYFVPTVADSQGRGFVALEPVHLRVTGSLFFDVDHLPGAVGPGKLKPMTSWEIHPITHLEILDE